MKLDTWNEVAAETMAMPEVEVPSFPDRTFRIDDFGAVGDGTTMNTEAFARAIEAAAAAGGGTVLVPAGMWLTGPIGMKSGVNLHVEKGAVVVFSPHPEHYPLVESTYEGLRTVRCQALIYGEDLVNIAITGQGVFDGSGEAWRPVKRGKMTESQWRKLVVSGGVVSEGGDVWWPSRQAMEGERAVPRLFQEGRGNAENLLPYRHYLRPNLLLFTRCRKVLLDGPTFQNSPSWCLHPWLCEHVTVRNVDVRNPWYAQNGDGLDLDSCRFVRVHDCRFDVGDDAICMKSGKDEDGRRLSAPCEYVTIRHCTVYHGHGGFVIGSEMSGGVRNIDVSDCTFIGTDTGLRFKSTRGRGGVVENIRIRNIRMKDIAGDAITFDLYYGRKTAEADVEPVPVSEETPQFRNIVIRDTVVKGAACAVRLRGLPEMPVNNVHFVRMTLEADRGVECAYAERIRFSDVAVAAKSDALFRLHNAKGVELERVRALAETAALLEVTGNDAGQIHCSELSAEKAETVLRHGPEVDRANIRGI